MKQQISIKVDVSELKWDNWSRKVVKVVVCYKSWR